MMRVGTAAVGLALLGALSCSSRNVSVDFDDAYAFGQASTYAWMERAPAQAVEGVPAERRVRRAVDTNLGDRGLRLAPLETADLVVTWLAEAEDERVYDAYGYGTGRWWNDESVTSTERVLTRGTLTVDIFDADTRQLVWRGTAVEAFAPNATPEQRDEMAAAAVAKMFEDFPPGSQLSQ